jgi:hypothetical protein
VLHTIAQGHAARARTREVVEVNDLEGVRGAESTDLMNAYDQKYSEEKGTIGNTGLGSFFDCDCDREPSGEATRVRFTQDRSQSKPFGPTAVI